MACEDGKYEVRKVKFADSNALAHVYVTTVKDAGRAREKRSPTKEVINRHKINSDHTISAIFDLFPTNIKRNIHHYFLKLLHHCCCASITSHAETQCAGSKILIFTPF
jgi:hypothetical protein